MTDLKDLEFLATKSREMVEKQIASYRQKHSNAGIIIGVIALFIPFFLNGLDSAFNWVKYLSVIPTALLVWAIIIMLRVLRAKLLFQSFSIDKFKDLVNKEYIEILLYEIGANNDSYRDNIIVDKRVNKEYNNGIKLTTIAIIVSVVLLLTNKFYQPEKPPYKIQILNSNNMSEQETKKEPLRIIPSVPPKDREQLNEGVDKRQLPPPQPKPTLKEK